MDCGLLHICYTNAKAAFSGLHYSVYLLVEVQTNRHVWILRTYKAFLPAERRSSVQVLVPEKDHSIPRLLLEVLCYHTSTRTLPPWRPWTKFSCLDGLGLAEAFSKIAVTLSPCQPVNPHTELLDPNRPPILIILSYLALAIHCSDPASARDTASGPCVRSPKNTRPWLKNQTCSSGSSVSLFGMDSEWRPRGGEYRKIKRLSCNMAHRARTLSCILTPHTRSAPPVQPQDFFQAYTLNDSLPVVGQWLACLYATVMQCQIPVACSVLQTRICTGCHNTVLPSPARPIPVRGTRYAWSGTPAHRR